MAILTNLNSTHEQGITLTNDIFYVPYLTGRKLSLGLNFRILQLLKYNVYILICVKTSNSLKTVRNMPSLSGPPFSALGLYGISSLIFNFVNLTTLRQVVQIKFAETH